MRVKTNSKNGMRTVSLLLALLILFEFPPVAKGDYGINGLVVDSETNEPIPNTDIVIFVQRWRWGRRSRWNLDHHIRSNEAGEFKVSLSQGYEYTLIASKDDKTTPGTDYVPQVIRVMREEQLDTIKFQLISGASVLMEEENFFVETSMIPFISYVVIDPITGDPLEFYGEHVQFGNGADTLNEQLNLPHNQLIIPSDTGIAVKVQAVASIGDATFKHEFILNQDDPLILSRGETEIIQLSEHLFPHNLQRVINESEQVNNLVDEKEDEGFFLGAERQRITRIDSLIKEAEAHYSQRSAELAFTKLREAYLEIVNVENWVNNMTSEAVKAISILLVFLSVASLALSYLLSEKPAYKLLIHSGLFAIFVLILYYLHPGSQLLQIEEFLKYVILSFASVEVFAHVSPYVLRGTGIGDKVPLRNMLIPLFSIAKRSLRRRRIRFLLTLITVTIMVTSFIALTSFSTGYGLIFRKLSVDRRGVNGVMIKSSGVPVKQARSAYSGGPGIYGDTPLDASILEWLETRNETEYLIPKYINQPQRQYREAYHPLGNLMGVPIFGVMAIDPILESMINPLEEALVSGRYFEAEEKGVLISQELAEKTGVEPGIDVEVKVLDHTYTLPLIGILDDDVLSNMMNLNGEPFLPPKIVEVNRVVVEGPDIIFEGFVPCSPGEMVILSIESMVEESGIPLNSLNLMLKEGWDLVDYAQKTALNRGVRTWASTSQGVYFAHVSQYFQGKGFPIILPWIIVVLNVLVTMLNSYYERRKEIDIYSSIGMNPAHISGIFLAEAAVIGIIGGSTGYIFGMGAYKIMNLLAPALTIKQKVSAIWSLASLGIALGAVLIGGIVALKSSINITPSLKRRWQAENESKRTKGGTQFETIIPLKVTDKEINVFKNYLLNRLREEGRRSDKVTKMVREKTEDNQITIDFIYTSADTTIGGFYAKNVLKLEKRGEDYQLVLDCTGTIESVQNTGNLLRKIVLDWSLL